MTKLSSKQVALVQVGVMLLVLSYALPLAWSPGLATGQRLFHAGLVLWSAAWFVWGAVKLWQHKPQ